MVAEQARGLSRSAAGVVLLPADEGGLEIVAVAADRPSTMLGEVVPPDSEIVTELLEGQAVFVADAADDPRTLTASARGYGPIMLLPLQNDGCVLGALVILRTRGKGRSARTSAASPSSSPHRPRSR